MSFLSDREIKHCVKTYSLIDPFIPHLVEDGVVSYGLSSYGYDVRVANKFKVFSPLKEGSRIIDPKSNDHPMIDIEIDDTTQHFLLPSGYFALCESVEVFNFGRNLTGYIAIKSTYARCGLLISAASIEPGWSGKLTIEVSNATPLNIKIYVGEGLVQVQFQHNSDPCEISYDDRKGKYQNYEYMVPIVREG